MSINQDITNLPTPPNRSDSPSDFSDKADAFLAALPNLQTELNTYADEANTTQTAINTSETNAATSEQNAAQSASDAEAFADAASAVVNAVEWVSTTTYNTNDAAIGSDGNTYRSLVDNNTGNDPVADDGTNWLKLTATTPDLVLKPEPVSPADGATDIGETPTLDGGPYYSLYGKDHAISRFQVAEDEAFTNIVYDSGEISATTTNTVLGGNLQTSTEYYWRVYYEDEDGVESEWSDALSFTTSAEFFGFTQEFIGTQAEGGFYAGNVFSDVDGYLKAVIVSDGGGDTDRTGAGTKAWRTSQTALTEAQTLADGKSVMDHIVANETLSNFPAFEWIKTTLNDANYNGYSDWYLPARDELELIYRHFKPTTQDNNDGTRPSGTEFGADGATYGTNNSSDPTGSGYTLSDPSQTTVTSFQDGGANYLTANYYWSSTEYDASTSWFQPFNDGAHFRINKDNPYRVRAVRNVTVETPYNPSNIGMEMDGGFYAGNVRSDVDGNWYAIIVSDATGDTDRSGAGEKQWRTSQTALTEAQTLSDGKSVMDHIVANETLADFPAFEWVQTTLNDTSHQGFNDWYIPARDELELIYRNFKPTTRNNNTGTRDSTGFGGDGAVYGTNTNIAPADYDGYTASDPSQTSISSFQDGGADYFTGGSYWSSTEYDANLSWRQTFFDGSQFSNTKDEGRYVRAVRRVQV